jgi:hypothetical protein
LLRLGKLFNRVILLVPFVILFFTGIEIRAATPQKGTGAMPGSLMAYFSNRFFKFEDDGWSWTGKGKDGSWIFMQKASNPSYVRGIVYAFPQPAGNTDLYKRVQHCLMAIRTISPDWSTASKWLTFAFKTPKGSEYRQKNVVYELAFEKEWYFLYITAVQ